MATRLQERVTAWEAEKADLLERMEALQTRLDQSPGQQQVSQLSSEMETLRGQLETTSAELAALKATLPPSPSPSVDDTLPPAPAPNVRIPEPPAPQPAPAQRRKKAWC